MYHPLNEENAPKIIAGLADGSMRPWRHDEQGRLWFTSAPALTIQGVPPDARIMAAADEGFEDDEEEDDFEDDDFEADDDCDEGEVFID